MEPVISPLVFYIINVLNTVLCMSVIALGLSLTYVIAFWSEKKYINFKTCIPLIISLALVIFIPSQSTMYKMLVASQITPNNVKIVQEATDAD